MTSKLLTLAVLIAIGHEVLAAQTRHQRTSVGEPLRTFRALDEKLTKFQQQLSGYRDAKGSARSRLARSMRLTLQSIDRSAFRLQSLYERRHDRFGVRMFRLLRRRTGAVRNALNQAHPPRAGTQENPESRLDNRVLALITQFQAASAGYSVLRCEPRQWTCCTPKRKEDLRPGESLACRWICVSKPNSCAGFRGSRAPSP